MINHDVKSNQSEPSKKENKNNRKSLETTLSNQQMIGENSSLNELIELISLNK